MGAEAPTPSLSFPDERVAALAARQNGVVTREQAIRCGVSADAIKHRLKRGRLHRLHRGVFLVGHAIPPPLAAETAAVLACGPEAVLSHESAARLWQIRAGEDTLVEQATAEAERQSLIPPPRAPLSHGPGPGRQGAGALKTVLSEGPAFTRSEAERRLLELIRRADLPRPHTNTRVEGLEFDFLWLDHRLVVEVDGYAFHSSKIAFQRDRDRDARLQGAGFRIMGLTWHDVTHEPHRLVARLAAALAR